METRELLQKTVLHCPSTPCLDQTKCFECLLEDKDYHLLCKLLERSIRRTWDHTHGSQQSRMLSGIWSSEAMTSFRSFIHALNTPNAQLVVLFVLAGITPFAAASYSSSFTGGRNLLLFNCTVFKGSRFRRCNDIDNLRFLAGCSSFDIVPSFKRRACAWRACAHYKPFKARFPRAIRELLHSGVFSRMI